MKTPAYGSSISERQKAALPGVCIAGKRALSQILLISMGRQINSITSIRQEEEELLEQLIVRYRGW